MPDLSLFTLKDLFILFVGVFFTIFWPLFLYRLKPNLRINKIKMQGKTLEISVKNEGCFDAVNIRIETCYVSNDGTKTLYFKIDREDFLILPKYNKDTGLCTRKFKINSISEITRKHTDYDSLLKRLESNEGILRVRVHAFNEYSGFGRAFEQKFSLIKGKFALIDKNSPKICKLVKSSDLIDNVILKWKKYVSLRKSSKLFE